MGIQQPVLSVSFFKGQNAITPLDIEEYPTGATFSVMVNHTVGFDIKKIFAEGELLYVATGGTEKAIGLTVDEAVSRMVKQIKASAESEILRLRGIIKTLSPGNVRDNDPPSLYDTLPEVYLKGGDNPQRSVQT